MSEVMATVFAVSPAEDEILAIRVLMMPRDTNARGTIFGGHIMSLIDQAGAIAAHATGGGNVVTVAMREVVFHEPVRVGDMVTCYARVVRVGRTSITIRVRVLARYPYEPEDEPRDVTEAEVVYVNVDEHGQPCPVRSP
jgi:acyl-CoA thioesterase YciA